MSHHDDDLDAVNSAGEQFQAERVQRDGGDRELSQHQSSPWLSLELYIKADQPELMTGLDQWLKLDLISQAQVKKICRNYLSCAIPLTTENDLLSQISPPVAQENLVDQNLVGAAGIETESSIEPSLNSNPLPKQPDISRPNRPNIITQVWLRFLDELSIRWLLFLGIFLVVVSSGVLAASQWNNFPKLGQYLILLVYTLSFWGFGLWSTKQENLRLTSQTLRAIATLLIPINFWALSHFGLGQNIWEWLAIALATASLTATFCWQTQLSKLQDKRKQNRSEARKLHPQRPFILVFLLLSYGHLGWQIPFFPVVTVYGGIIALTLLQQNYHLKAPQKYSIIRLLFLFVAWSILLLRALTNGADGSFASHLHSYNLAIALFAWLLGNIALAQADQNNAANSQVNTASRFFSHVWQSISVIIFCFTWAMSLAGVARADSSIWHTVVISLLAIHFCYQRLTLYWRKRDLTAIFLLGLQTLYVAKELIPANLRSQALDLAVEVSKTTYLPESVFGVTFFPYLILWIGVATWLYQQQKPQLALYTEWLTLFFGLGLTCLSLSNPTWRSLNLLLTTVTLGYVAYRRRPLRKTLVYLTHLMGLITLVNGIDLSLPNLSQNLWGSIFAILTVAEWMIYLRQIKQPRIKKTRSKKSVRNSNFILLLQQSCWYFGLLLSALSYICFLDQLPELTTGTTWHGGRHWGLSWGLLWLTTPAMLTAIAQYTRKMPLRRLATCLSCTALILVQLLTLGQPVIRIIALTAAIALMFVNAFNLRRTIVTLVHLGFGLALAASLFNSMMARSGLNNWYWLVAGGIALIALYQLQSYLQTWVSSPKFDYISQRTAHGILGVGLETKNYKLIGKYIQAADYWAIALVVSEIAVLSLVYLNFRAVGIYFPYLLTTLLLTAAVFYRYQKQPNNLVLFTLVWLVELFTTGLIMTLGGSNLLCAIANIVLGGLALLVVGGIVQAGSIWTRLNLAYVPLAYVALGICWRLSYFNAYTGLLTLGSALILLNTRQDNKQTSSLINYLGIASISWGIYELVVYRLWQSSGVSTADGLTILALIAGAIAICYRLAAWWSRQRHQSMLWGLKLSQVILIAHLHWVVSSCLKIMAAGIALNNNSVRLTLISLATSFCLGAYAVIQGRDTDRNNDSAETDKASDWWVYVGLVEIAATLVYGRLIINRLSLLDPGRVVFTCAIALLIYQIPWQNLGWRTTPWQRVALILPALMTLATAEDIANFSLIVTAVFYLRIAYVQKNLRWSYVSLGFINWGVIRFIWQQNIAFIWLAAAVGLSICYMAQFDPYFCNHRRQRHYLRLVGSSILGITALFYPGWGLIPGIISLGLIFAGLAMRIRAFLYVGTVTLILTVIYQLIILVLTYSFLKWIVGLLTGIGAIVIAASFERRRDHFKSQLQNYNEQLQNWQ